MCIFPPQHIHIMNGLFIYLFSESEFVLSKGEGSEEVLGNLTPNNNIKNEYQPS